jgi:hypothetical protein
MKKVLNFINGEWCESSTGKVAPVLNPATGEVLAEVTQSAKEDVDRNSGDWCQPLNVLKFSIMLLFY